MLIIGAGYVGLSLGVVLSNVHKITLIDVDNERVDAINRGSSPIYEPGVKELLAAALKEEHLIAQTPEDSILEQDIALICVGTPSESDGSIDLKFLQNAADMLVNWASQISTNYNVLGIKSTVPPGTTRRLLLDKIKETESLSSKVGVVFNPEFLSEGHAIENAKNPDRIIIGTQSDRAADQMMKMYLESLGKDACVFVKMSMESAELTKYARIFCANGR